MQLLPPSQAAPPKMSNATIRHRSSAGKHGGDSAPTHIARVDSLRGGGISARPNTNLHAGVWVRIVAIVALFTIVVLSISRAGKSKVASNVIAQIDGTVSNSGNVRVGVQKGISEEGNPLFVTVVMPSVVNPTNRPLRLMNIAKTWGPASRAIYVVHSPDEYPEGEQIDKESKSRTYYPGNLLVPEHITRDQGVERLDHVIRTVQKDINPDFAFFVNDHTFVLPDHMCQFLKEHDSTKDLYAGHALKGKKEAAFNSGAAGYVLSRHTMKGLIKEWDNPKSKCSAKNASKWIQGNPGLLTAQCFGEVLNIPVVDTRDTKEDLSHKFHAYGIIRTVTGKVDDWYMNKHESLDSILGVDKKYHHKLQHGAKCCSTQTISFHYVEAGESLAFWELMQTIQKSPDMSDGEIKELMNKVWPRDKAGLGFYSHGLPGPHLDAWNGIIQVLRKISVGVVPASC